MATPDTEASKDAKCHQTYVDITNYLKSGTYQTSMRQHFAACIESGEMKPFPSQLVRAKRPIKTQRVQLHCDVFPRMEKSQWLSVISVECGSTRTAKQFLTLCLTPHIHLLVLQPLCSISLNYQYLQHTDIILLSLLLKFYLIL